MTPKPRWSKGWCRTSCGFRRSTPPSYRWMRWTRNKMRVVPGLDVEGHVGGERVRAHAPSSRRSWAASIRSLAAGSRATSGAGRCRRCLSLISRIAVLMPLCTVGLLQHFLPHGRALWLRRLRHRRQPGHSMGLAGSRTGLAAAAARVGLAESCGPAWDCGRLLDRLPVLRVQRTRLCRCANAVLAEGAHQRTRRAQPGPCHRRGHPPPTARSRWPHRYPVR